MVSVNPIRVLLVEDNPGDARLIREMLAEAEALNFNIEWVSRLADGLEWLGRDHIDVVLLDLGLPDSQGLDTFIKAYEQAPHVPFVVLTGLSDETLALTAVRKGAQDYLFKDETNPHLLMRSIRYATERKRAELALEAERKKLFSVLNSLPAFVHLKDEDLAIKFANRRFTEYFGKPDNRPCYEVLWGRNEVCEDCRAREVIKTKTPQKFEWISPVPDRIFEVYNYPFCADDGMEVLTLGIDITERKQAEEALRHSEEHYRSLFENILNGLAYCKVIFEGNKPVDFIYLNVNRAFEVLTGLKNVKGKRVSEVIPGIRESDPELLEAYGHVALTGQPAKFETFVKAMNEWFSVSVYSPQKEYFVAVFNVITQRKRDEEKLRESEQNLRYLASRLLDAQERERIRIAHELHDDLGQSLFVLKMQIGGIARSLPPELEKIREECSDSNESVLEIINSVRRLSHDLIPPTLTEIGLKAALKDLLNEFSRYHSISCSLDADELQDLFSMDTKLNIYRVVQESLTNVGKYSEATKVNVAIKRKDQEVLLSVEDNGIGFDLERVLTSKGKKSGLGLASMEERARIMGGTFNIWSKPNAGTKIQITFPLGN